MGEDRQKTVKPWALVLAALLCLGAGLAIGAGLAALFADAPSATKVEDGQKVVGLPPMKPQWIRNAVVVPENGGKPLIAVIVDDLGLNQTRSKVAIGLPGPLTLAFLPYAPKLPEQAASARKAGHELLVHVPMEPEGKLGDPGPQALMTHMQSQEILERLRWNLDRFDHYVGINNHMGSKFTQDADRLALVFQELKTRGLLFIDSRTSAETVAKKLAGKIGLPFAERRVFIDNSRSAENVKERLAKLEAVARTEGSAIAIGHPHEVTMVALREWLPTLSEKGFALVPVSAVVQRRLGKKTGVAGN